MSQITVEQLQKMCEELAKKRAAIEEIKEQKTKLEEDLDQHERVLLATLGELKLDSFKSQYGTVSKRATFSWKTPKGDALIDFTKYLDAHEQGGHYALMSYNSKTLNSYLKQKMEEAKEKKEFLRIPGIDEPTMQETLVFTRSKT